MPTPATQWSSVLTKPERLLLARFKELEEDWVVTIEELMAQLHLSKTAIRLALVSLSEYGFLSFTPREEQDE